jgi:hypothetical protein
VLPPVVFIFPRLPELRNPRQYRSKISRSSQHFTISDLRRSPSSSVTFCRNLQLPSSPAYCLDKIQEEIQKMNEIPNFISFVSRSALLFAALDVALGQPTPIPSNVPTPNPSGPSYSPTHAPSMGVPAPSTDMNIGLGVGLGLGLGVVLIIGIGIALGLSPKCNPHMRRAGELESSNVQ